MSSRFDNLIKLVVDKFEINDYNLLSEALSITQIQDQLKEKNIDLSQYNPKHYLFLLALLNSNLNLDIYNQIITNIKDQGILNRLMSQTIDRRSNNPTVDSDIINRVLQNTSNIPELNAILNSIGQNREKEKPVATEEDKAKGLEDFATRIKKEVTKAITSKFDDAWANTILYFIFNLIDKEKEKYPNDRLLQNYSYALPMASYFVNSKNFDEREKFQILLSNLFPRYMADKDIRDKKVIFNDPYRSDFYKFSNYLYQYFREKRYKEEGKDGDLMNAYVFKNEDVTVYAGTIDDTHGSIRRCIKYGKGVNPKYAFCISGSSAGRHYTDYRFDVHSYGRKHLTTYFVYFNKPEDIKKYNTELFIFEPFYDYKTNELKYQYNKGAGNPGEARITPEDAIKIYPMLEEPLEKGVFKVVEVDENEKEKYNKVKNSSISNLQNVDELIDWIEATDPTLYGANFGEIKNKFPEGVEYALDFYIKRKIDFAEDNIDVGNFVRNNNSLEKYVFGNIQTFLDENPELKEKYDKIRPTLKPKEIRMVTTNGVQVNSTYFEKIAEEYPKYIEKALDDYIAARENSWTERDGEMYKWIFSSLNNFFEKYPQYKEKYTSTISEYEIKEMESVISTGSKVNSDFFKRFKNNHPDLYENALDRYVESRIKNYFENTYNDNTLKTYVFDSIQEFIENIPSDKYRKYKFTPELKQKEINKLIELNRTVDYRYLKDLEYNYPDFLLDFLDRYFKARTEKILKNSRNQSSVTGYVKELYYGVDTYIKELQTNHPTFKNRYTKYEKQLIIHHFDVVGDSHISISGYDIQELKELHPDILEKCLEEYLDKKIKLMGDVSYNAGNGHYYDSHDNSYDYDEAHSLYMEPPVLDLIGPFLSQNPELENKLKPKLKKLENTIKINAIVLTNKILDSEEVENLKATVSEEELYAILDRYFESKTTEVNRIKNFTSRYDVDLPPQADMENELFVPLRKFFYYNPKVVARYEPLQKELKLLAFEICGLREDTFVDSDHSYEYDYSKMYLTSGWLRDVQRRFPDILEKGLDIYLNQKLKQIIERNVKKSYHDDDEYRLVNIDSEVFKRIHEFEEDNKSLFKKYDSLRMNSIKIFIKDMKFYDLLDSAFFFRLEETFESDFYADIFKEYINRKLEYIKDIKKKKEEHDNEGYYYNEADFFNKIPDHDFYGYIFDPLEEFMQHHPELNQDEEYRKDLKYQFLVKYLTTPRDDSSNDLKKKALNYLNYLNNNNKDNTEIYEKIINGIMSSYEKTNSIYNTLKSYKAFYENIDDRITLKKIFLIDSNKEHLLRLIFANDIGRIVSNSDVRFYFQDLIKFKIKSAKLKNADSKSFIRMVSEITPNVGDLLIKEILEAIQSSTLPIRFHIILEAFFNEKDVFEYLNNDSSLKNDLYKTVSSNKITGIDFSQIRSLDLDFSLRKYLNFIEQFPNYEDNIIHKALTKEDQNLIDRYKKIETQNNGIIDGSSLNIKFYKTPPDLRNIILNNSYGAELRITIHSFSPIESLKFLPQTFLRKATLTISECVLKNNIDYLPHGTTNLVLERTTISSDKSLIGNNVNTSDIRIIALSNVENLKSLENLNVKELYKLSIRNCKELVSLKGCPPTVSVFEISSCDKLTSLKGSPFEAKINVDLMYLNNLKNFVGIPRSPKYTLQYNTINSFKGLPDKIKILQIADFIHYKNLVRKSYSYFPSSIEEIYFTGSNGGKSSFSRYLFSRIKKVFPRYLGNINSYLYNYSTDPFEKQIYEIYKQKQKEFKSKEEKQKESVERIKQERTPTKEDELEAIEAQQDKIANREKIKRLSKEELELITPFNVLLEGIMNTIKTSFKVYK